MYIGGSNERHFRVVELENKKVQLGGVSISSKGSPGNAARKLLTSIAHEKGLKKNKKASMPKVKFCIQEFTQGSSKKIYGPYIGYFHKYTAAELKKAKTAGGKVKFTMKPVVKLFKKKNNQKGGLFGSNSCTKEGNKNSKEYAMCELNKGLKGVNGKYDALSNRAMEHIEKALDSKQLNKNDTIKARIQKVNKYLKDEHNDKIKLNYNNDKTIYFEIVLQSTLNLDLHVVLGILNNRQFKTFGEGQVNTATRSRMTTGGTISYQFSGVDQFNTYELEFLKVAKNAKSVFVGIKKRNSNDYLNFNDLKSKNQNN